MKKLFFLLLPLSFILTSCNGVDSVTFNDNLVTYSNDADKRMESLDSKLDVFFDSEELSAEKSAKLVEDMKVVKDSLQIDLDKIKNMPKHSTGDEFHTATVAYVESLIAQVDVYSQQYGSLSDKTTDEDLAKMDEPINKSLEDSEKKLDEMIRVQKIFAKANNIQLTY